MSFVLMTLALFLVQYLHATYFGDVSATDLSVAALEVHQEMFEYFGTFTRCMLTMFELAFANWPPATRLITANVSEWFLVLCLAFKMTMGFAVIGVLNGVIMQETFRVAATDNYIMVRQKKAAAQTTEAKMVLLFDSLDSSKDGKIDFAEFQQIAQDAHIKA